MANIRLLDLIKTNSLPNYITVDFSKHKLIIYGRLKSKLYSLTAHIGVNESLMLDDQDTHYLLEYSVGKNGINLLEVPIASFILVLHASVVENRYDNKLIYTTVELNAKYNNGRTEELISDDYEINTNAPHGIIPYSFKIMSHEAQSDEIIVLDQNDMIELTRLLRGV